MAQSHSHTHSNSGRGRHAASTHENGAVTQERYQKLKRKVRDMENVSSLYFNFRNEQLVNGRSYRIAEKVFYQRKIIGYTYGDEKSYAICQNIFPLWIQL